MLDAPKGRRTQVVKGEVCKTSMQRFESARRLHFSLGYLFAQSLEAVAEGVRLAEVGYLLVVAGLFVIYFLSSRSRQKTSKQGN